MPATVIGDRFQVEREAASGGMGTVFRGRDLDTGAAVAIKLLSDGGGDPQRFAREAIILSRLDHPAIVRYVAHGLLDDGRPYLVMDWIDGHTVDDRLERGGLTIADTLIMGRRVAEALGYAHLRGVVHRDIKPTNLMFPGGDVDQATVVDFGVARPVARVNSLTETGTVVGTPSYMAPEQARGQRDIGPPADVFALGCVLYECLTGRMAFEGQRFLALTAKIVLWDPPPARACNANVLPGLDQLIGRMLAKEPGERPADGGEVAALLAAIPLDRSRSGEPRPRQPSAPTTVVRKAVTGPSRPQRLAAFVVATPMEALDAGAATLTCERAEDEHSTLAAMLEPFHGRVDLLHDGSVLVCLSGASTPLELALRAAQCAFAVRRGLPDALVGATLGEVDAGTHLSGESVQFLLDETVAALARDAMALVFAGVASQVPAGAIRIDDRIAALLDRDYPIVRVDGGLYLGAG